MKHQIAFIHAAPAAIAPLTQYYADTAPDLEITNLLDDGLLRLFQRGESAAARERLANMIRTASKGDGAELAMLTCSAVPQDVVEALRVQADIPLLKIDEPLCRAAISAGKKIGVLVAFAPTLETTASLLERTAAQMGSSIQLLPEVVPQAQQAMLAGDIARYHDLLLEAIKRLHVKGPDVIVLAQVSMSGVLARLEADFGIPVLSSLNTSLTAIRQSLMLYGNHHPPQELV